MATADPHDPALARRLILDELFDLSLYKALRGIMDIVDWKRIPVHFLY